jgi:dipeptidyl aminopeptidase/acylaminoacyl peptidase
MLAAPSANPLTRRRRAVITAWAFVLIGCAASSAEEKPAELTVSVRKGGNWQLVTLDVSGENSRVLIEEPHDLNFPTWSPDGRRLAFVSAKDGRTMGRSSLLHPRGPGTTTCGASMPTVAIR